MVSILVEENQWSSQDISAHKTPEIRWQEQDGRANTVQSTRVRMRHMDYDAGKSRSQTQTGLSLYLVGNGLCLA